MYIYIYIYVYTHISSSLLTQGGTTCLNATCLTRVFFKGGE